MRTCLAVVAAALAAGPVEGLAENSPVLLGDSKQVSGLCSELVPTERLRLPGNPLERGKAEAAHEARRTTTFERRYRVEIPGDRISFVPYDEDDGTLLVSPRTVLTAAGGSLRLWASEDADLPVQVSPEAARRILEAQEARSLVLALTFDLPEEDQDGSPCAHVAATRVYTLGVEPVSWEYRSKGNVLARGGEGAERPLVTAAQGARPLVEIGEPVGDLETRSAVATRAKELSGCYTEALRRNPALDGTVIVEVRLRGEGGAPQDVRVAVDSAQDDALAACVRGAVARARFPRAKASTATVPIHFTLAPPASR